MKKETKTLLIKYGISFGAASLIAVIVFWIQGFFTDSVAVNIQILSDGFFVSGLLFLFLAGMMFVSGEGALLGISYVLKNVILFFIPGGRAKHELYKDYRERRMNKIKAYSDSCLLVTGLVFIAASFILTLIWYVKFYDPSVLV